MQKQNVAIVGASGYSGEELVRLLLSHPFAVLSTVTSRQYAGKTLGEVFPKFANHPRAKSLRFTEPAMDALAQRIPLKLIRNTETGILGAAVHAQILARG